MKKDSSTPVYTREILLKSKEFSHIQPDFLKAILKEKEYTMEAAKTVVNKFFGGDVSGRRNLDNTEQG